MKKISVFLSVFMLLALVLSACTTPTAAPTAAPVETAAPTEAPTPEPTVNPLAGVVIQFWHVYSDAPGEGLQALVDEFNATNEYGITVEALNQGNYGDVEDKMNAGIQSGDLPDVVMAYTNSLADW